jgi:hypothetical protein
MGHFCVQEQSPEDQPNAWVPRADLHAYALQLGVGVSVVNCLLAVIGNTMLCGYVIYRGTVDGIHGFMFRYGYGWACVAHVTPTGPGVTGHCVGGIWARFWAWTSGTRTFGLRSTHALKRPAEMPAGCSRVRTLGNMQLLRCMSLHSTFDGWGYDLIRAWRVGCAGLAGLTGIQW